MKNFIILALSFLIVTSPLAHSEDELVHWDYWRGFGSSLLFNWSKTPQRAASLVRGAWTVVSEPFKAGADVVIGLHAIATDRDLRDVTFYSQSANGSRTR